MSVKSGKPARLVAPLLASISWITWTFFAELGCCYDKGTGADWVEVTFTFAHTMEMAGPEDTGISAETK